MPFYYTVMASLSVRTMVMLHRRPGDCIPIADLREYFVSRALVGQRLVTMATNGFLQPCGNDYALSPKGRRTAAGLPVARGYDRQWATWKQDGPGDPSTAMRRLPIR